MSRVSSRSVAGHRSLKASPLLGDPCVRIRQLKTLRCCPNRQGGRSQWNTTLRVGLPQEHELKRRYGAVPRRAGRWTTSGMQSLTRISTRARGGSHTPPEGQQGQARLRYGPFSGKTALWDTQQLSCFDTAASRCIQIERVKK